MFLKILLVTFAAFELYLNGIITLLLMFFYQLHKMRKIFMISLIIGLVYCPVASATNLVQNGGFEDNFLGWTVGGSGDGYFNIQSSEGIPGKYASCVVGYQGHSRYICQNVDLSDVDSLSFYWKLPSFNGQPISVKLDSYDSDIVLWSHSGYQATWAYAAVDVSGYSGNRDVYFVVNAVSTYAYGHFDTITADDGQAAHKSFITWTTYPADSWKVGNYSTLMIGVPDIYKNFTFQYKTPSSDYTVMPIQKHMIPRTYNYSEGIWYNWYAKFPYHPVHGNYSCKITHFGMQSETKTVYIPYFDPDIDIPDVITIPIPDVIVDPPQWNVTVPPKYDNVSWLTNYTDFWDGIGNSINYTQYATVGLLLIPLEALNTSVYTLFVYVDDASSMVQGFEHCAVIVRSGWDIIPSEIQTLFVGSATLGVVVFLLHRRT